MLGNVILLLVEDYAAIRISLEISLTEAGFRVLTAANGNDAISELNKPNNNLSGLITDIQLGTNEDGWDVARRARELNPSLPIVYMTGNSADAWEANGVPNSSLVQKPFVDAQIIVAISALPNAASEQPQG